MPIPQTDIQLLQRTIDQSKEILIVTPAKPTLDRMAASLAFYLAFPQLGKRMVIACPEKITVDVANLVGIDKVTDELGGKNFIVSLDYVEGSIEKVSYNIEGDKFNLVIEPRSGFSFSADKVQYRSSGTNADLIICLGASRLEELGSFTEEIKALDAPIVNIDINPQNSKFGKINLIYPAGSFSEIVTAILSQLSITMDNDTATNLLSGITSGTDHFTSSQTSPDSFEAAAMLLRSGAQKNIGTKPRVPAQGDGGTGYYPTPQPSQTRRPTPFRPQPPPRPYTSSQPYKVEQKDEAPDTQPEEATPPDWLRPKIFRSRNQNPPVGYTPSEGKGSLS